MAEAKLKPCPFCGGEARFYGGNSTSPIYCDGAIVDVEWDYSPVYVKCKSCRASTVEFDSDNDDQNYEDAEKAWNRMADNGNKKSV